MRQFRNNALLWLVGAGLAAATTGCYEGGLYEAGAPETLQQQIDSIAAAKAAAAAASSGGDTTAVEITKEDIGAADCSTAWFGDFSQSFEVPAGKALTIEFKNISSGASNWNNWNLDLCNHASAHSTDDDASYAEYVVLRADKYGWGDGYEGALNTTNYGNEETSWETWLAAMNGAQVSLNIDHSTSGATYITATQIGNDGKTYIEELTCEITPASSYYAFLIVDNSCLQIQKAYLTPSTRGPIADQNAEKLTITGAPSAIVLGDENFWKGAVATVSYSDGTTEVADSADIKFEVLPDLTTIGTKTVVAAYSKTKQGNFGPAVAATYQIAVTAAVSSIKIEPAASAYYYAPGTSELKPEDISPESLIKQVLGITGGDNIIIPSAEYKAEIVSASLSSISLKVTYKEFSASISIDAKQMEATVVSGSQLKASSFGLADFSNGWWPAAKPEPVTSCFYDLQGHQIGSGEAIKFKMTVKSLATGNYMAPCVVLKDGAEIYSGQTEYAVLRPDNYGWGTGYDASKNILSSNWDWAVWDARPNLLQDCEMYITITNYGNDTASVLYEIISNGSTYTVEYTAGVVSSNLYATFVTEESQAIMHD